ncbi:MAG TPA: hypothetical protein VNO31_15490 [Umezawaea sp.]|nr:hypothetical protein [Umezawaea sp.]
MTALERLRRVGMLVLIGVITGRVGVSAAIEFEEAAEYAAAIGLSRAEFEQVFTVTAKHHERSPRAALWMDLRSRLRCRAGGLEWRP